MCHDEAGEEHEPAIVDAFQTFRLRHTSLKQQYISCTLKHMHVYLL